MNSVEIKKLAIENVDNFIKKYGVKFSTKELSTYSGIYLIYREDVNQMRIIGNSPTKKKIQIYCFKKLKKHEIPYLMIEGETFVKFLRILKKFNEIDEIFNCFE